MNPSVKLMAVTQPTELDTPIELIEYAGRVDYNSISKMDSGDHDIVRRWIASGHESMIEMVDAVFMITCSRVVSHELVRHRAGTSFQQESQRYVRYADEDPEDLFYVPEEWEGTEPGEILAASYQRSLSDYRSLIEMGVPKQMARYILPNATRTRIVMKANLREWRHILMLRMHTSAQPEMQKIANMIHDILVNLFPEIFSDVRGVVDGGGRSAR